MSPFSPFVLQKMTVSVITSLETTQTIPVEKPHGEFIWTRWAMLSYKLGPSQKTLGWLLPGLLWGNGERLVHPFPFLALPRHVRDEPSQKKKSDLQWLLDRLRGEQCGNYGWQEGRCVVERRGPARRNHPVPEALKEPQRNWKKNKQVAKAQAFFFFFNLLLWHPHDIESYKSLRIFGSL